MQTATNPQTGEKVQWNGTAWAPMGGGVPSAPAAAPGVQTFGTPRPPDPFKVRDQQLQEEAAARAREDQQFQREKFEREMAKEVNDPKLAGEERTAAFLATRVGGGMADIRNALAEHPSDERPGVIASIVGSVSDDARNLVNTEGRQRIEAAQMDVLDAALTLGTGAAYSPEQLRGYTRSYFPQIGDDAKTVADKQARLRRLFEAAKIKAGGAAPQIDQALAMLDPAPQNQSPPDDTDVGIDFDEHGRPLDVLIGGQPNPETQSRIDERLNKTGSLGSFVAGASDAATFGFNDEINAGVDAFQQALSGQGSFSDLYGRNVGVERAVKDRLLDSRPLSYVGGQLTGGIALPVGAGASGARELGLLGALQGGAYGAGSGEGGLVDRLPGAATGAALGGAVGGTLGAVVPRVGNALARPRPGVAARQEEAAEALPIIEAGQRQGVPIRQPDARPTMRADFAAVEASQTGNAPVTRALQADKAKVQSRVREVGGDGHALDDFDMGQRVQEAGRTYLSKTKSQANALYRRAETAAGDAQGTPQKALDALDANIADLRETGEKTNAGAIKYLADLKADLQGGASIAKLRNIRSNVRGQINERNLTHTDTERRVSGVLDALGQDVEAILPAKARAAFRSADDFYRERMTFKTQVIERFMGPKNNPTSPEQAASRFNSFMKSKDFGRFQRMMKEMEPEDRADIAATVAENLGVARNGEFSLAALSTNIDKFSNRAIRELFGEDGAKAIADLKVIARAKADTAGALNNSRTGVVENRNGLRDILFGVFGGGVAGAPGAVGGFFARGAIEKIGNARAARMMLNPDFTKWLKTTPQTKSPEAINRHFSRLTSIASRDAVFTADVKALQQFLADSFSQSPGRLAASQEEDN